MPRVSPLAIALSLAVPTALAASAACSARITNATSVDAAAEPSSPDGGSPAAHEDDAGVGSVGDSGGSVNLTVGDADSTLDARPPGTDASALTCAGPSFDASASFGANVTGLYTKCAMFSGGDVWMASGFDVPVTLTIAESDAGLTATYTYYDAGAGTLDFQATSSTTATLAPALQKVGTQTPEACAVGAAVTVPATLATASGAITYDSNTVFLSLLGVNSPTVAPVAPCAAGQGEGTLSILCERGNDAGAAAGGPSDAGAPASGAGFVPGSYACSSTTGGSDFASGGSGTLTLTQTGGVITAAYSDQDLSGTLRFVATSDTTANPVADGQTLSMTDWTPAPTPVTLGVTAASLSMDCGTLFLSVVGTVSPVDGGTSTLEGAALAGTVTCTLQ